MLALRAARLQTKTIPPPCSARIFVRTSMSDTAVITSYTREGLKDWFGRGLNSRSKYYKLPADGREMNRLSLQHRIWRLMVGGLFPRESEHDIRKALRQAERSLRQPYILDIGSGSGIWAIEMAMMFPNAKVVGVDLIESKPPHKPPNCSFRIADVTKGLEEYEGKFDVVHCRSVAGHVTDAVELTRTIGKCLKPGGVFLSADANKGVFTSEKRLCIPASTDGRTSNDGRSWFARWMLEVTDRWTSKGHANTEGDKLSSLIRNDAQFDLSGEKAYWSPVNWSGDDVPNGTEIGRLMVLNAIDFMESSKPALLSEELPEHVVDSWIKNAQEEVLDPSQHLLMKWVVAWAVKRH